MLSEEAVHTNVGGNEIQKTRYMTCITIAFSNIAKACVLLTCL